MDKRPDRKTTAIAALPGRFSFIRVLKPFSACFCFSLLFPMFCAITAPFLRVLRGFIGPKYPVNQKTRCFCFGSAGSNPPILARDCLIGRFPSACALPFLLLLQATFRPACVLRSAYVMPYSLPPGTGSQGKSNLTRSRHNIYIFL